MKITLDFIGVLAFTGLALYFFHHGVNYLEDHLRWKDNHELMEAIGFFLAGILSLVMMLYFLDRMLIHV